jgi:hypothetical protein
MLRGMIRKVISGPAGCLPFIFAAASLKFAA